MLASSWLVGCGAATRMDDAKPAPSGVTSGQEPPATVSPFAAASVLEGEMALAAGNPSLAIASFTMALTSEPDEPLIMVLLARAHLAAGSPDRAEEIVQQLLDAQPGFDAALVLLGDIRLERQDVPGAEAAWLEALEHEPGSREALSRLVDLYRQTGDLEAALAAARALVDADPLDEHAHLEAAEICLEMNRHEEAFEHMSAYILVMPVVSGQADRWGSVMELASRLLDNGEPRKAVLLYRIRLDEAPDDVDALAGLARALVALGDTLAARDVIATIPVPGPDAPASHRHLPAQLWLEAGRPDRAVSTLEAGFGFIGPTLPAGVKLTWVTALARALRFDEAAGSLDDFGPQESAFRARATDAIATSLIQVGRHVEAWSLLVGSDTDMGKHLESRGLRRALLALLIGRPDDPVAVEVREICPAWPAGRLVTVEETFWSNPSPDAHALVEDLAEIRSMTDAPSVRADALHLEAVCVAEGVCPGKPTDLLSLISRIAAIDPADPRLPALRGRFALESGNLDRAVVTLDQSVTRDPLHPLARLWLAEVLVEVGDVERARDLVLTTLLMAPSPRAQVRAIDLVQQMPPASLP